MLLYFLSPSLFFRISKYKINSCFPFQVSRFNSYASRNMILKPSNIVLRRILNFRNLLFLFSLGKVLIWNQSALIRINVFWLEKNQIFYICRKAFKNSNFRDLLFLLDGFLDLFASYRRRLLDKSIQYLTKRTKKT